jgi:hypothetical protein
VDDSQDADDAIVVLVGDLKPLHLVESNARLANIESLMSELGGVLQLMDGSQ